MAEDTEQTYELTDYDKKDWDVWDRYNYQKELPREQRVNQALGYGPPGAVELPGYTRWEPGEQLHDMLDYWTFDQEEYGTEEAVERGISTHHDIPGVGWLPINQAVNRSQYLAPETGSDWEHTKFVYAPWHTGGDWRSGPWNVNRYEFNQPQTYGWDPTTDIATGKGRLYTTTSIGTPGKTGYPIPPKYDKWAIEVIDFDAYSKDFQYQEALRSMRGMEGTTTTIPFRNIQEIMDARDIIIGKVDPHQQQREDALAEVTQDLELVESQLDELLAPKPIEINIPGLEALGGVSQFAELQQQQSTWQQNVTDQLAASQQGLTDQLSQAQQGWATAQQGLTDQLSQAQQGFTNQLGTAQQSFADQLSLAQQGWDARFEQQATTAQERYETLQNIYGGQNEEDRAAWEQQAADQRADFAKQLEALDLRTDAERETVAKQLEDYRQLTEDQRAAYQDQLGQLTDQGWEDRLALAEQLGNLDTRSQLEKQAYDTRIREQEAAFKAQQDLAAQEAQSRYDELQTESQTRYEELQREATLAQEAAEREALSASEEQKREFSRQLAAYDERTTEEKAAWDIRWDAGQEAWDEQYTTSKEEWEGQMSEQKTQFEEEAAERAAEYALQTEQREEDYRQQTGQLEEDYLRQTEDIQAAYDDQRAEFARQLETYQSEAAQKAELRAQDWEHRFTQAQAQQAADAKLERRDLESQLKEFGNQYQLDWANKTAEFQADYIELLNQTKTDADKARLEQAANFERMQQDQQAAWGTQAQGLAEKDRIFETQIGELRRDLGIETDKLGTAQHALNLSLQGISSEEKAARQQLASQLGQDISAVGQTAAEARQGLASQLSSAALSRQELASQLGQDISAVGTQSEAARQELASQLTQQQTALQENVTGQLGSLRQDITGYKETLASQKQAQDEYYAANKRFREMQIQDAERARASASYGAGGRPLNRQVKGVRRAGSSSPGGVVRSRTPRSVFHRSGLRISSLNI